MNNIKRAALLATLGLGAVAMTGCCTSKPHDDTAAVAPAATTPYVQTAIPVVDRFGSTHGEMVAMETERRADVATVQSVALDDSWQAPEVQVESAKTEQPWWKKIELHGSITFGISKSL